MSAKSLQHRALLRRRAPMSRAVLPYPSARPVWLLAGIIDTALSRWARAHPLDGGGDEDADTGADTAVLDGDDDFDDIAPLASQPFTSPQHSSLLLYPSAPSGSSLFFFLVCLGDLELDALSSKTTGCASPSFLTCLPSSGQSTNVVLRDSYFFQLDRGSTGKGGVFAS